MEIKTGIKEQLHINCCKHKLSEDTAVFGYVGSAVAAAAADHYLVIASTVIVYLLLLLYTKY